MPLARFVISLVAVAAAAAIYCWHPSSAAVFCRFCFAVFAFFLVSVSASDGCPLYSLPFFSSFFSVAAAASIKT